MDNNPTDKEHPESTQSITSENSNNPIDQTIYSIKRRHSEGISSSYEIDPQYGLISIRDNFTNTQEEFANAQIQPTNTQIQPINKESVNEFVYEQINICEPEEVLEFINELKRWCFSNERDINNKEHLEEFSFLYCFKTKVKKAKIERGVLKRKRGGTISGIGMEEIEESKSYYKIASFQLKYLLLATSRCNIIREMEIEQQIEILKRMTPYYVLGGSTIIHQKESGEYFSIIYSGSFYVYKDGNYLTTLYPGSFFGEISLLYGEPRTATIISKTNSLIFSIHTNTFRSIIIKLSEKKRINRLKFLYNIPIFKELPNDVIEELIRSFSEKKYYKGEVIVKENDEGDHFFVIINGSALVTKKNSNINTKLISGDWFGEVALLSKSKRNATIIAESDSKCLVLGRSSFVRLLGKQLTKQLINKTADLDN
eukprot:GHVP01036655.1.p1 GENE.GHVP01036655.1~~GHVP01036655.1.p1  ORF type:complete len:427 (+),score=63.21 GHVP01036655.1:71-1351(+)